MGNSYAGVKEKALKDRQTKLENQMVNVKASCDKWNITQERAKKISNHTVQEIVDMLNKNQINSEALVAALALRCSTVGRDINVFIATNFGYALQAAQICDLKRKQTGKKNWTFQDGQFNQQKHLPPLFGIPISLKDVFHTEGMPTTLGLLSKADNYEPQSLLIKSLKNSGMIPYIKTNIPQLGMTIQTNNNLWGRTVNPWNKNMSVGGSSGGEAAIVSSKCSLIGLGSDIGGSIRIPSEFCGVFGLKSYSGRISSNYHSVFSNAFTCFGKVIPLCIGPIAKSARDMALFMDVASTQKFYNGQNDPYSKIVPFDKKTFLSYQKGEKKLRVGYIKSLKDFPPSNASKRALQEAIQILKKQGHQLFEIQIPEERQVIIEFTRQYTSSKMKNYRQMLKGQKQIKEYNMLFLLGEMIYPVWYGIGAIAKRIYPRPYFYFFNKKPFNSVLQYQRHVGEIAEFKAKWIKYWRSKQLDIVICPGFGCQSFPHGMSQNAGLAGSYTLIWNVLDMTTGSMPITVVRQDQLNYQCPFNDIMSKSLKQIAAKSKGLPVGIQVVGLPFAQQEILGFMSYLDRRVKFYQKHPLPDI